tara:strand:- start:971 stop:1438 length:468 start_codon:yes stop_codon:yes gene_type:complete
MATYKGFMLMSGKANVANIPEANSQTFYRGAPVGLSGGKVAALSDTAEADIFGIAMRDSKGDTNNANCAVSVITPEQRWKARLKAGATADTPAEISRGAGYILDLTASHWTVDGDTAATEGQGFVIEDYTAGDSAVDGAEVWGRFGRLACLAVEG